jgi:hypothetical protein
MGNGLHRVCDDDSQVKVAWPRVTASHRTDEQDPLDARFRPQCLDEMVHRTPEDRNSVFEPDWSLSS